MALKKINARIEAQKIGGAKDQLKAVEGYIIGARYGIGKKGKNKGSTIYQFIDKKHERVDVWGNASINAALCREDGKFNPNLGNKLVRIQFVKMGKAKKGQSAPTICDVLCDEKDVYKIAK